MKGLVKRKGRDREENIVLDGDAGRRRRNFRRRDARTMSMQMIGRRSISVPGCDQNFPATGSGGSSALSPRPPQPPPPWPPRETKGGGRAPVDNGPMALRMQAQGSALFEFVAFCLCLSAATSLPLLLHLFPPTLALPTSLRPLRRAAPFFPLFVLPDPPYTPSSRVRSAQIAIANLPPLCLLPLFPLALRRATSHEPLNLLESVNRAGEGSEHAVNTFLIPPRPLFDVHFNVCILDRRNRSKKTERVMRYREEEVEEGRG